MIKNLTSDQMGRLVLRTRMGEKAVLKDKPGELMCCEKGGSGLLGVNARHVNSGGLEVTSNLSAGAWILLEETAARRPIPRLSEGINMVTEVGG